MSCLDCQSCKIRTLRSRQGVILAKYLFCNTGHWIYTKDTHTRLPFRVIKLTHQEIITGRIVQRSLFLQRCAEFDDMSQEKAPILANLREFYDEGIREVGPRMLQVDGVWKQSEIGKPV